ncbi:N-acetylmuramoyl-L-alanine amidase [Aestuariivirga sp.]|uniref:N-acetylmuramoyl-L-alanine amidase n=1 Tax=Aestuariivirga sp. TaxID=2650926 RepID=UPI0037840CC3
MIRSPLARELRDAVNCEPRRNARPVDMIVLHYTGMSSAAAACERLCGKDGGVSCHYLVDEDGTIIQMVGEEYRAWHAGISMWHGETDINSRSIGIEIQNPGHGPDYREFPIDQMAAVVSLCRDIASRHRVPDRHVLAHSDVAPGRKIDPGERFDWEFLHRHGVGHWVPPEPPGGPLLDSAELRRFQELLAGYGYGLAVTGALDDQTRRVSDAFTRHFRPLQVTQEPDRSVLVTAERLVA